MRSTEVALSGVILIFFLAARIIPSLGMFRGFYFYMILGIFHYWIPKKLELLWMIIIELQLGFQMMFFDWWLYIVSIESFLSTSFGVPHLSHLEMLIYGGIGFAYLFVFRIYLYYFSKRTLGKKIKNMLPNIYNMKD